MKKLAEIIAFIVVVLTGLFCAYISMALFCIVLAFIMQFLFPIFMEIIAIKWPAWVIFHADKFSSWFVFFVTIKLLIGTFIPIRPEIKKQENQNG